jgi:hypothetical protein
MTLGHAGNPPKLGGFSKLIAMVCSCPMLTDYLLRTYICGAITALGVILFFAVDELEPHRRLAAILQCALLAVGGGAIANQLMS